MSGYFIIQGMLIGMVVAVPVGPLGLLCINRALATGALCGLFSGLGVATADGLAACLAALGISFVSDFLLEHQTVLRTAGGMFLCYLGWQIYRTKPRTQQAPNHVNGLFNSYSTTFFPTFSKPVTILLFLAVYGRLHVSGVDGANFPPAVVSFG